MGMGSDIAKPALSGAIGTSFMTAFSSLVSEKNDRQFREHEILSELLKIFPLDHRKRMVISWIGHFTTGMAFNLVNQRLLKKLKTPPTFLNGIFLGAANGAFGIAIWKAIFVLHPSPPKIDLNRYLGHLLLAHLVFAIVSNLSMKGIKPSQNISLTALNN